MAPIPAYWYVEPDGFRLGLEEFPDLIGLGPVPTTGHAHLIDSLTGEINGEAILMCTLPWPRFRCAGNGAQVFLPHWHAEALERLEAVVRTHVLEGSCTGCNDQLTYGSLHLRVEVVDAKVKAFYVHSCGYQLTIS